MHDTVQRSAIPFVLAVVLAVPTLGAQQQSADVALPVISLVQAPSGGNVRGDEPVLVLRFAVGEPDDPVNVRRFAITVDGEDRTTRFRGAVIEVRGVVLAHADGVSSEGSTGDATGSRCSARGACRGVTTITRAGAAPEASPAEPWSRWLVVLDLLLRILRCLLVS